MGRWRRSNNCVLSDTELAAVKSSTPRSEAIYSTNWFDTTLHSKPILSEALSSYTTLAIRMGFPTWTQNKKTYDLNIRLFRFKQEYGT